MGINHGYERGVAKLAEQNLTRTNEPECIYGCVRLLTPPHDTAEHACAAFPVNSGQSRTHAILVNRPPVNACGSCATISF